MKKVLFVLLFFTSNVKAQSVEITPSGASTISSSNSSNYLNIRKTGTNTYSGLRFYQVNSLRGGLFYSDENTHLNLGYSALQPGIVWNLSNQRVGIGTFEPEGKLHILANSSAAVPHILVKENNNADGARISFENFSIDNKRWTLYGINQNTNNSPSTVFNIFHTDFGNVAQFSADGVSHLTGFTKLGSTAPAIQMRKYTGTLPDANSHSFNLPTTVPFNKIIDYNIFVNVQDPELIPIGSNNYAVYKYLPHDNNPSGCNYRAVIMQDFSSGSATPPAKVSFTNIGNKVKQRQYTVVVYYEM